MPYIGIDDQDRNHMLRVIGISRVEDLFIDIPESLLLNRDLNLEESYSEWKLQRYFEDLASLNHTAPNLFKGAGCYAHHVPALVQSISSRAEFLTSYTPYQPEVSQGTLEAIYKFQSYICELTGMEIANASMYDAATALAEAITMSWRLDKNRQIFLSKFLHPEYLAVIRNYLEPLGIEYKFYDSISDIPKGSTLVIQNPNFYGEIISDDAAAVLARTIAAEEIFLIVAVAEAYAMTIGYRADELGAKIVCGSAQSFGNPVYYGGAQVGFIASKQEYIRQMPGRIVGKTKDRKGQLGYVLTFQTREQHIKRDRASSNICTNQSLHALSVAVYLSQMGSQGLFQISQDIWIKTQALQSALSMLPGVEIKTTNSFNEFCVAVGYNSPLADLLEVYGVKVSSLLKETGTLFSLDFTKDLYLISVSELHSIDDLNSFVVDLASRLTSIGVDLRLPIIDQSILDKFVDEYQELHRPEIRILNQGELQVCRYFTNLSKKNFSIDTNFYPLGSCTMKYNPKINDLIAGSQSWTTLHPYLDSSRVQGVLEVYSELNQALCEITGFHRFSFQTAAGAHGEYAALLMAKKYFEDINQDRDIVLVPDSAHGTNPASASMAGFTTVTIKSNKDGNVDIEDLKSTIQEYSNRIAVFMMTNPNTLGLFDQNILEVVSIVHQDGGLMYYDGANLNAIVGVCRPGDMGFDLLHLNLHKTFSTPHGGGGPGAGPVGASVKLSPYLPGPELKRNSGSQLFWDYSSSSSIGRVRSFYGNFNVLIRALAYIKRNGRDGLKRVGEVATLNANYLQAKVKQSPILSSEQILQPKFSRISKHEFIISASNIKERYGISALDIAKRLLDKGIHAPTIYFPLIIPETIMIEPTETESREALDSLVKALEEIVLEASTEDGARMIKQAPLSTEFSRFDEVLAVKEPVLSSKME